MNKKGGCWPPSGPPAAKNQVFLILMWMLPPSKASGGKKSSIFFDFYIAFERFLTCGDDRSRQIIAKSGFKSEKLALCVELWPKHSQKRNLVPMFRYSGTPRGNGDCVQVHNGRYVAICINMKRSKFSN